jgi:hypothetical protein
VKVNVKDVLTTMLVVVLTNRHSIGRAHGLHCGRDTRKRRHQRTCKVAVNIIDPGHMPNGHDEHMAPIKRLLTPTRKNRGLAVAKRHNTRRQLTPQDETENTRRCCFRGHR